jgi:hypothetical protein
VRRDDAASLPLDDPAPGPAEASEASAKMLFRVSLLDIFPEETTCLFCLYPIDRYLTFIAHFTDETDLQYKFYDMTLRYAA